MPRSTKILRRHYLTHLAVIWEAHFHLVSVLHMLPTVVLLAFWLLELLWQCSSNEKGSPSTPKLLYSCCRLLQLTILSVQLLSSFVYFQPWCGWNLLWVEQNDLNWFISLNMVVRNKFMMRRRNARKRAFPKGWCQAIRHRSSYDMVWLTWVMYLKYIDRI